LASVVGGVQTKLRFVLECRVYRDIEDVSVIDVAIYFDFGDAVIYTPR
jgi:hypothetical protein